MSEALGGSGNLARLDSQANLWHMAFPEDEGNPVRGITDDVIIADNTRELLSDSRVITSELVEEGQLIGLSVAMPVGMMDPQREAESADTAYIYCTVIHPDKQGEGKVGPLIDTMFDKLQNSGYAYVERDCIIEDGYADNVQKTYKGAIISSYDHEGYYNTGLERFFRIDINNAINLRREKTAQQRIEELYKQLEASEGTSPEAVFGPGAQAVADDFIAKMNKQDMPGAVNLPIGQERYAKGYVIGATECGKEKDDSDGKGIYNATFAAKVYLCEDGKLRALIKDMYIPDSFNDSNLPFDLDHYSDVVMNDNFRCGKIETDPETGATRLYPMPFEQRLNQIATEG